MSFSARHVPAVLFLFLSLAVPVCAQSTATQIKTPRGSISGRVTIKDKGAPRVAIGARKDGGRYPYAEPFLKATTDQDGNYRLGNLAPGTYDVTLSSPAYVITDANIQRSKQVIVAEGENVEDINFSLVRGGVITGKVTDADGRPLIQQQVYLFRADAFQTEPGPGVQRSASAVTAVLTDDRGIYRMYGLAAGSYKVAAGRSDDGSRPGTISRTSYKRVFHPDVTEDSRATVIVVTEGSEARDVDISLGRAQQTYSASGRVVDDKGLPVPNMRFGLQSSSGQRLGPTLIGSNSHGEFVIEGLIPARYGLFIAPSPASQNKYSDLRTESTTFDIVDHDVTDITIRLVKGVSLSGIVVLESNDKTAIQKFQQMQLQAYVMGPGGSAYTNGSMSPIGPDGSFRVGGLPAGIANFFLGSQTAPFGGRGFTISRIERDGIPAPGRGLEVKDGEQVTGVRVTVVYGTATIRGLVKFENGSMPSDGQIVVRLMKPGESSSNLPYVRVDARGHFLIEALPAGVYELDASIASGPAIGRRGKQGVTVQDGVVSDVVVTIDLGTTPQ